MFTLEFAEVSVNSYNDALHSWGGLQFDFLKALSFQEFPGRSQGRDTVQQSNYHFSEQEIIATVV